MATTNENRPASRHEFEWREPDARRFGEEMAGTRTAQEWELLEDDVDRECDVIDSAVEDRSAWQIVKHAALDARGRVSRRV